MGTIRGRVAAAGLLAAALVGVVPDGAAVSAGPAAAPHRAAAGGATFDPCPRAGAEPLRSRLGGSARVTFALAAGSGSSYVTITECARTRTGRWTRTATSTGRVGRSGFAPPGAKREGDGRTPTGVFRLGTAFGAADPGSRLGYLRLTPGQCWGSRVGTRTYNRPFRGTCRSPDESMYAYVRGAYRQGIVIEYNRPVVRQGLGSAIFLHVRTAGATAGCVSTAHSTVLRIIRQARPGDRIVMGPRTAFFGS